MPDNCVYTVVTDPPYGLSSVPDCAEVLQHWLRGDDYEHGGSGFMGKKWDSFVPGPATWREVYRVLKPGGHALVFAGQRTQDLMGISLRLAGFEVRDTLMWMFGTGFPKSLQVSKSIDKAVGIEREDKFEGSFKRRAGPTGNKKCQTCGKWLVSGSPCKCARPQDQAVSEDAIKWQGWGSALKPAYEPVLLVRKLLEGTVAGNVLKYGSGGLNIDGCRIGVTVADIGQIRTMNRHQRQRDTSGQTWGLSKLSGDQPQVVRRDGRWPANVVLSHSEDCVPLGTKKVKPAGGDVARGTKARENKVYGQDHRTHPGWTAYKGADGLEEVERWDCVPGCPVAELDRQSGNRPTKRNEKPSDCDPATGGVFVGQTFQGNRGPRGYTDDGGASRFFATFPGEAPFLYQAKASRSEREAGCENLPVRRVAASNGAQSAVERGEKPEHGIGLNESKDVHCHHPTIKPLRLMRWLCRLVTPLNGIVLDPFAGSGTTGCAALQEGFRFVGFELEDEYVPIAEARIKHWSSNAPGLVAAVPKARTEGTTAPAPRQRAPKPKTAKKQPLVPAEVADGIRKACVFCGAFNEVKNGGFDCDKCGGWQKVRAVA